MVSLQNAEFLTSANELSGCPGDEGCEVAFAGRSNAGKSSALNVITNRRSLARISKTPGRTRLINFFQVAAQARLVDLPGYGYARVPAKVRAHWRSMMGDYFEHRQSLSGLVVIMDVRRPLMPYDRQMLTYGGEAGLDMHVLLTKADKLSRGAASGALQKTRAQLNPRITIQLFSALKHTGVEQARERIAKWLDSKEKDLDAD